MNEELKKIREKYNNIISILPEVGFFDLNYAKRKEFTERIAQIIQSENDEERHYYIKLVYDKAQSIGLNFGDIVRMIDGFKVSRERLEVPYATTFNGAVTTRDITRHLASIFRSNLDASFEFFLNEYIPNWDKYNLLFGCDNSQEGST